MKNLEIKTLQSVNGVPFGSNKTEVRKAFGKKFEEYPKNFILFFKFKTFIILLRLITLVFSEIIFISH